MHRLPEFKGWVWYVFAGFKISVIEKGGSSEPSETPAYVLEHTTDDLLASNVMPPHY